MAAPLTEYERLRAQNIAKNMEKMASIGVLAAVDDFETVKPHKHPAKTPGSRPEKKRKVINNSPIVVRRSLRTQGLSPEFSSQSSRSGSRHMDDYDPQKSDPFIMDGPVALRDTFHDSSSENVQKLLNTVRDLEISQKDCRDKDRSDSFFVNSESTLTSLNLKDEHFKKVIMNRVLFVEFFPIREKLVIVAGGKEGYLGIWDVNHESANENVTDGKSDDGVYTYRPHKNSISNVAFSPEDCTKLYTASSDGTVRKLDVDCELFDLMYLDEEIHFSAFCASPSSHGTLYLTDFHGNIHLFDCRTKTIVGSHSCHEKRINSIMANPFHEYQLVTSSLDCFVSLWDIRKLESDSDMRRRFLLSSKFSRAVNSAFFSPDGRKIAATSYDNSITVWGAEEESSTDVKLTSHYKMSHNNETGRWISPFKAIWAWDSDHILVGGMNRTVDVFSAKQRISKLSITSDNLTNIPSRLGIHPHYGVLAGGSASGKVYVFK